MLLNTSSLKLIAKPLHNIRLLANCYHHSAVSWNCDGIVDMDKDSLYYTQIKNQFPQIIKLHCFPSCRTLKFSNQQAFVRGLLWCILPQDTLILVWTNSCIYFTCKSVGIEQLGSIVLKIESNFVITVSRSWLLFCSNSLWYKLALSLVHTSCKCKALFIASHGCFQSDCFVGVEHSSTVANYSLRSCDVKIRFALAGSRNGASLWSHNIP